MRTLVKYSVLALAAAVLLSGPSAKADENRFDKHFLSKAGVCGTGEVKMSELAEQHASSPKVKMFARELVRNHREWNKQIADIAKNQNLQLETGVDADIRGTLDGLAAMNGPAFDRAYLTRMVQDHEKAVKLFEDEAKNGSNAELKKFSNDALPKIQEHLKQARNLANELNGK
jgi:putative membrane protein